MKRLVVVFHLIFLFLVFSGSVFAQSVDNITLSTTKAGENALYTVTFTPSATKFVPNDGKIVLTFDAGFTLNSVTIASSSTMDGGFTISVAGDSVTLTRDGTGTPSSAGAQVDVSFANVGNNQTAGSYNLKVTIKQNDDTPIETIGTKSFSIEPADLDHFSFGAISTQTAGSSFQITITAQDAYNNTITTANYSLTLTDETGTLTTVSAGSWSSGVIQPTVNITKATASDKITATANGVSSSSGNFAVDPAGVNSFELTTIGSPQTAGTAFSVTITAKDSYDNVATGFTGTVDLTLSNGQTISPSTSNNFTSGVLTQNFTINKADTDIRITVSDGSGHTGTSNLFNVNPGSVNSFEISQISSQAAGEPFTITVTAKDAQGNTATSFAGKVDISDGTGTISPTQSGSFSNGVWSGSVTITGTKTDNTITVTNSAGSETGTSNAFDVTASDVASFTISSISSPQTAGTAFSITVTAKDASGNTATSFTGTASLSDSTGTISPKLTGNFTNGVWTGNVTITQSFSSNQIVVSAVGKSGSSNAFDVNPGALDHFTVDAINSPQTAGTAFNVKMTAKDAYENTVTSYSGTPSLSNTTSTISPTTTGAFSNGVRTESVTITKATSSDQITVTDGSATGTSNTFTVQAGALDHIVIEDAPGGTGAAVGALSLTTDQNASLFAIGYDANNNYVEDVSVSWSVSGGIGSVSPTSGTNTVFNPTSDGTGSVTADDGSGHTDATGTITVSVGTLAELRILDAANGAGSEVTSHSMTTDESFTVYAAGYDADGNYIADQSVTWSSTGLSPAAGGTGTSYTFSPDATGSGTLTATKGSLTAHTGAITVTAGTLASIQIRDEAGGGGSAVGDVAMTTDDSRTFYAAGYDADGNYIADQNVTWASTGSLSPAISSNGESVTFAPDQPGSGTITADAGSGITDATGTVTVSVGALKYVKIVGGASGDGPEYTTGTFSPGQQQVFHAAGYDADGNYIADESVSWSLTGSIGSLSDATGTSTTFTATTVGQGSISADHATALDDATGTLTVTQGTLDHIVIRDAPGGAGNVVGDVNLTADQSLTLYAAGYDDAGNYLGDYDVTWSLNSGNLVPAPSGTSSSYTFNPTTAPASGVIKAAVNTSISDVTGTISVSVGALAKIQIRSAANGGGVEVTTHTMTTDETYTVWAAGYDADGNFIADQTVNWTSSGLTPALASSGTSATLDPSKPGTATVTATEPNSGLTDNTGAIVIHVGAVTHLLVRSEAGGGGMEVGDMTLTLDDKLTLYAAGYDGENNYARDVVANWSVSSGNLDAPSPLTGTSTVFDPSTPGTSGKIRADSSGLTGDETGTLTVGSVSYVKIRDAAGGSGNEVGNRTITADESLTLYAAGYDAGGNYVGDVSVTWSSTGDLRPIVTGTGTSVTFSPSKAPASGTINADHATATDDVTGTITVTPGVPVGTLTLTASPTAIPADGASTSTITSDVIHDADGNVVAQGTLITVSTTLGTITTADASSAYSGKQVAVDATGKISFTLRAPTSGGTAYITAASVGGSATGSTSVQITNLRIVSISSDYSTVSQGQTGVPVRMVVENLGSATLENATANLTFTDSHGNDRTADYGGVSVSGISVSGGTSETITFSVSVGSAATLGTMILDGNLSGTVDGNAVSTTGATTPFSWTVQTPAALQIVSVQAARDSVSRGQQGISVVMTVQNTGQATATISSASLSFRKGATNVTGEYVQSQASGNPTQISGGASAQFEFLVDVTASATTGTITLDGAIYGKDANSGVSISDVGASTTDSWVVTQAAAFQITALTPSQSTVTAGQTQSWTVKMALKNNSSSDINLDLAPSKTYIKFVIGSNVTSEYSIGYPTALVGGGTKLRAGNTDTLVFTIHVTGTTAGIAAINGFVTGTDQVTGKTITDETNDTGSGSVVVQTPTSAQVTSIVTSQDSVTSGQTAVWTVTVTVENTGQSAATLNLDSTRLSFRRGSGYVTAKPAGFQGGGLVLPGNTSKELVFSVTKTAVFSGADTIDAHIGLNENNSGRYVSTETTTAHYGLVTVQTPAHLTILSVTPSQQSVTRQQPNSWTVRVVVKNTGQSRVALDFGETKTFLSFVLNGVGRTDYTVQQPTRLEGSRGDVLYGGQTDSLTFTVTATGADTGTVTIHGTVAGIESNSGRAVSDNTFGGNSGQVLVQAPPAIAYISSSLLPKSVNRGSNAAFEVRVHNSGGATLVLLPTETKISFSDGVHNFEALLNSNVLTEIQPGDTTLAFVSTLVPELMATQNYTPTLTLKGTENGNAFQTSVSTDANELEILEKAVLDIVSLTPSQNTVTRGQSKDWIIWMNVANNGGSSVRLDSTQLHLFIGTEVTDEYTISVPGGFWQPDGTENPVLGGNQTGTLRFVVTHTGQTTGPATIQGRLWVTDLVSHEQLFDQTDGGAGTVRVQDPASLRIVYTMVSQAAVTIGQEEDWQVKVTIRNEGGSDLAIDTSRTASYLTFVNGGHTLTDFVVKQPTELSTGGLILPGGGEAQLVFTIDRTTAQTGYCLIYAHISGVEVNSDSVIFDENHDSGWNGVTVQSESSVQIVSTENTAFNSPYVNTGQNFGVRVKVRNNGGEAVKNVKVALLSTGASIFSSPKIISRINAGLTYSLIFPVKASDQFDSTEVFTARILQAFSANTGDTIRVAASVDSVAEAKIQRPASLVILKVFTSRDTISASQTDEWQVFVVVQDTGQANVLLNSFSASNISFKIGGEAQEDYLIVPPDSLPGGGMVLYGGETDTLTYRVKATGHLGGTATITASLRGRDVNSLFSLNASQSTSVVVQTSATIQIISTTVSAPHVVSGGNAEVNEGQSFAISVMVENKGNERVDNVVVGLRTKGKSQLLDTQATIPYIPARATRLAQFDVVADTSENLLGEEFDSHLISGTASVSHLPAVLAVALDSVAVARIEKPALLKLSATINDQDGILSASQAFEVRASVSNEGRATTIGSGKAVVTLPENYQLLKNGDTLSVQKDTLTYTIENNAVWHVLTPRLTQGPDSILVALLSVPKDANSFKAAQVLADSDTVVVSTVGESQIASHGTVISPPGAVDGVVSTEQEFVIKTHLTATPNLTQLKAKLNLPKGYVYLSPKLQMAQGDSILWTIRAPESQDQVKHPLIIQAEGKDESGSAVASEDDTVWVKAVKRANLSLDVYITQPEGARDGVLTVGQPFVVRALVTNTGSANVYGNSAVKIDFGATGVTTTEPLEKHFEPGKPVDWHVVAPDTVTAEALLRVTIDSIPYDENSNRLSFVSVDNKSLRVSTVHSASLSNSLAIVSPEGARDGVISTYQEFVVEATVESQNCQRITSELILPPGFYTENRVKNADPGYFVVSWVVKAPAEPVSRRAIKVITRAYDANNDTLHIVSKPDSVDITTTSRANAVVVASISNPPEAANGIVSTREEFTVKGVIQNLGLANFYTEGALQISVPKGFMLKSDTVQATQNYQATWLVEAPAEPTVVPKNIRIKMVTTPKDENTNARAFVTSSVDEIALTVEQKKLTLLKWGEVHSSSVVKGQKNIPVLGLILRNLGIAGSNEIWLQGLKLTLQDRKGKALSPKGTVDRIWVAPGNRPDQVLAELTNPDKNPLEFSFSPAMVISPTRDDTISIFVNLSASSKVTDFQIGFDGTKDVDAIDGVSKFPVLICNPAGTPVKALAIQSDFAVVLSTNLEKTFGNYPNPFGELGKEKTRFVYYLEKNTDGSIQIFTLTGDLVWSKSFKETDRLGSKGLHDGDIIWNGRNENGLAVVNGVYIAVLSTKSGKKAYTKIAVVK